MTTGQFQESAMSTEWRDDLQTIDWAELSALYRAAPLGNKSPDHLRKVFANSMFRCFAFEGGALIGAGRALADGADCSYLCDIAVLPSHQGTGLGKHIVRRLLDASRGHRKIILYAVPGKEPFYKRFGFLRMKTAMAIFENQQRQVERGYLSETQERRAFRDGLMCSSVCKYRSFSRSVRGTPPDIART